MAGDHDLAATIVVGRLDDFFGPVRSERGFGADFLGLGHVRAEQSGHRALARRDRLLHGLAT